MIKISIYKKDIMILNIYAPNKKDSKYKKQNLTNLGKKIRQTHNYSWKLQHTTLSKHKQAENQQGYRRAKQHNQPTISN